jgi:hypothetical protein
MRNDDNVPSLGERMLGAIAAFLFTALTTFGLPWIVAAKSTFFPIVPISPFLSIVFWTLVFAISIFFFTVGFRFGIYDVMDIFNQIWETGETNNRSIRDAADRYRLIIFTVAIVAYAFGGFFGKKF